MAVGYVTALRNSRLDALTTFIGGSAFDSGNAIAVWVSRRSRFRRSHDPPLYFRVALPGIMMDLPWKG